MRTPSRVVVLPALLALVLFAGREPARADDPKPAAYAPTQDLVAALRLGPGIPTSEVILFPLYLEKAPAALELLPSSTSGKVKFEEPANPKKIDNLLVKNTGAKPALVLGGTVLEGGLRDRLVLHDHVIPAGGELEFRTLPASTTAGARREAIPFRTAEMLAPPYLRTKASVGQGRNLVPTFVLHLLDFRNENDVRESLASIGESELLAAYCLSCHRSIAEWPKKAELGTVVGGIAVVRGRVQLAELFGTNALLATYFEPILRSLSFPAAAIELRAKKINLPVPGAEDGDKVLAKATEAAEDLLARLKRADYTKDTGPKGDLAEAFVVRLSDGAQGRAVQLNGRMVHVAVFPDDPFERILYGGTLTPELTILGDMDKPGAAELKRRGSLPGVRLTEAEKRFLGRAP